MRIAHLSTYLTGGAAIAARRLHEGLLARGVESRFFFMRGEPPNETYRRLDLRSRSGLRHLWRRMLFEPRQRALQKALVGRPSGLDLFTLPRAVHPFGVSELAPAPDVVNLHWVADFVDYPAFFASMPSSLPIVWTLHDMNPFTGGCHYALECEGFTRACGTCPQIANSSRSDISARTLQEKVRALSTKRLHVVADSHWLEGEARRSRVFSGAASVRTIHYGLDHESFCPRPKQDSKQALGIQAYRPTLAFGADGIQNERKGLRHLLSAVAQLRRSGIEPTLLVFGGGNAAALFRDQGADVVALGAVHSPTLLAAVYSAADVFVIPSLDEAFGQTALEAMACGTPVVGYDTGGIPDMVEPGVTGELAARGDWAALAERIRQLLLDSAQRTRMGVAARQLVESRFKLDDQARNYEELYRTVVRAGSHP